MKLKIGILLLLIAGLCYLYQGNIERAYLNYKSQKVDFIFSEGFKGQVIVVDNHPCGQKEILLNGREQLIIPENGIFLYQKKLDSSTIGFKYYYANLNKTEIPSFDQYMFFDDAAQKQDSKALGAWMNGRLEKTNYSFLKLILSSKVNYDNHSNWKTNEEHEHITDSLVQSCK